MPTYKRKIGKFGAIPNDRRNKDIVGFISSARAKLATFGFLPVVTKILEAVLIDGMEFSALCRRRTKHRLSLPVIRIVLEWSCRAFDVRQQLSLLARIMEADAEDIEWKIQLHGAVRPIPQLLTKRQMSIVRLVLKHKMNSEIGRKIGIDEQTVKNHLWNVFNKLKISSREELIVILFDYFKNAGK